MSEKKPRLFLEWDGSGEPVALIVEGPEDLCRASGLLLDDLRELLTGDHADGQEIRIIRKLMTDEEVKALPDL